MEKKKTQKKRNLSGFMKKKVLRKDTIPLYLMALPGAAVLFLFSYLPMTGLVLAFKKYRVADGIFGSPWVGFKNFEFLFASSDAWIIIRNTVVYNVVFIVVNTLLAVGLALLMNEVHSRRAAKIYQTTYMMPYFMSWAVVAIIGMAFLDYQNGYLNVIRDSMGYARHIEWYHQIGIWPFLLVFVNAWKNVGYQTVLYLAVISGIPKDYYEAAALDGASRLQQARYITIPHLRFIISISTIMALGGIFRGDFGLFYTFTKDSGPLYPVINVLDSYIYRSLENNSNMGMSTAAGLLQSVVGFIFILAANKIVTRIDPDSAMF